MKRFVERYPAGTNRFFEILIPLSSWLIITMPLWLSFWHPAVVAYFVIGFDVYWFYKSFTIAVNGIRAYLTLSSHVKVDWLALSKTYADHEKIHHVIIIPEYGEPIAVLRETLTNLTKQDFPHDQITIVLGTEERDEHAQTVSSTLKKEFGGFFRNFLVTIHPDNPHEIAGKSSNMAWAGRKIVELLESENYDLSYTTVTSCDADVMLHPKYLSNLTVQFLSDPERQFHFYQAAVMFYSNIWRVPLPGRMLNTVSSIFNLSLLKQERRLINFSTYSVCLKTVKESGFWSVNVIPEDYHLFFKTYFTFGEKVQTRPIFLPVLADAAESTTFWKTMGNQYEQYKRWAWGVSDVPYVLRNYLTHTHISFWDRTLRVLFLLEQHLLWPTNWFILTLGSTIPPIVNKSFARSVLGHNLAQISSAILTFSIIFIVIIALIDARAKPPRPKEFKRWQIPILYLQWLTLPVVSFFLGALPGLDAHTRLMLGKRLEYRVTEKIRKEEKI